MTRGGWPVEVWQRHGITYLPSERTKSELYLEALPAMNAGRIELLDLSMLRLQLLGLERRAVVGTAWTIAPARATTWRMPRAAPS